VFFGIGHSNGAIAELHNNLLVEPIITLSLRISDTSIDSNCIPFHSQVSGASLLLPKPCT